MTRLVALLALLAVAAGCQPKRCVDSAEIVGPTESMRDCAPGARVDVREVSAVGERRMLMTCVCPSAQPDGGR